MIRTLASISTAWLALLASVPVALAVHSPGAPGATGPKSGSSRAMGTGLEVAGGPSARPYPRIQWSQGSQAPPAASRAWASFATTNAGPWQTLWDVDTGVPKRIFGAGVAMPGSVDSPKRAEAYARAFLARHIDLLAPGARVEDFVVVTNHLGDGMRTIGMVQHYQGMRVLGGQVSFRFKNDRLFVIGSEALPHVSAPVATRKRATASMRSAAVAWVGADANRAWARASEGPYVLPIISHGSVSYRTVMRTTVEAREPMGRWHVYMDAVTGDAVARRQALRFAEGTVQYNVPQRYPSGTRIDAPARDTAMVVDSILTASNSDGTVLWDGDQPATVQTMVEGPLVRVINDSGDEAIQTFTLQPGGTVRWLTSGDEHRDAQLATFIHAREAKDFSRTFAPELDYLDQELIATVNMEESCNAFSDGFTINFFSRSALCENTGLLSDVIYHEFGHVLHRQAILDGVGAFDGAFSEGLSDYFAAALNDDPAMGRGFFFTDDPLRHIDPPDKEHRWPDDIGEIHHTGLIFAGAMWDLRKSLIASYGSEEGAIRANQLFYAAVQRSVDIPSSYVEILAADDDDGDLSNGTPNECIINVAFGSLHGLRDIGVDMTMLGPQPAGRDGYDISLRVTGLIGDRCLGDEVESVTLQWGLRGEGELTGEVEISDAGDGTYTGVIPGQPEGSVVRYRVIVDIVGGGTWTFPTNLADDAYEFYTGDLIELYCTDFETDVFASGGWTHEVLLGNPNIVQWEWGTPQGRSVDPGVPFAGVGVIGTDIGNDSKDGVYNNDTVTVARSPLIEVGNYTDVRLQYRRWLTVEDAQYDHANIYANDELVWRNLETDDGNIHHLDTQWVFHDVPLSQGIVDGTVQVAFELASDQGLEFGGWNVDDVCVVANPRSVCGDGMVTGAEACDDAGANSDTEANACRTNCRLAACGDGVLDSGEACDDGNAQDDDGCTSLCEYSNGGGEGCACTVGESDSGVPPLLWLMGLFAVWRFTRRRRVSR